MFSLPTSLSEALQRLIRRPDLNRDWPYLLFAALVALAVPGVVRLMELPNWSHPALKVNGEFIQATHDAYYWLAGAKGVGGSAGTPLARLLAYAHATTGIELGNLAFFLPVLLCGIVAVSTVLWAWLLGGVEFAMLAGCLASLAPAFFFRSRLGYYDSDFFTMGGPLFTSFLVALALSPHLGSLGEIGSLVRRLRGGTAPTPEPPLSSRAFAWLLVLPLLAGLLAWAMRLIHPNILYYHQISLCLALPLCLLLGTEGRRSQLIWSLCVSMTVSIMPLAGLALGVALFLSSQRFPAICAKAGRAALLPLAFFLAFVLLSNTGQLASERISSFLMSYYKHVEETESSPAHTERPSIVYPGITQSVIEAQNSTPYELLSRFHASKAVGVAAFIGCLLLLPARPLVLLLVPMFSLFAGSLVLGNRMAMFGGPPMGLGLAMLLAFGASLLLPKEATARRTVRLGLCLAGTVATLLLALPAYNLAKEVQPTPIIQRLHALGLQGAVKNTPPKATFWTWWDFGYATTYFAERRSYADGGFHSGEIIYPLALALSSPNALLSNQIIRYTATTNYTPWLIWNTKTPEELKQFLFALSQKRFPLASSDPQYLVVSFENIRLAGWIIFYGSWDFETRSGFHGRVMTLESQARIDKARGSVEILEGLGSDKGPIPLDSITILDSTGRKSSRYENDTGKHMLIFPEISQTYLMSSEVYNSMMVQLLLAEKNDPRITENFNLVYDGFPYVRIFEVL